MTRRRRGPGHYFGFVFAAILTTAVAIGLLWLIVAMVTGIVGMIVGMFTP